MKRIKWWKGLVLLLVAVLAIAQQYVTGSKEVEQ